MGEEPRLGEKAARLGELERAGFPVPPGVVVLPDAFERFLDRNGLRPGLRRWLGTAMSDVPATLVTAAEEIDALIESASFPPELAAAIGDAARGLDDGRTRFAVRSSRPPAPGSALGRTRLNVHGEAAVLAAVRSCWGAAYRPRELLLATQKGEPPRPATVLIQAMVDAVKSGVLLTRERGEGPDVMSIQAIWGLGGPTSPGEAHAYEIEATDFALRSVTPGAQLHKLVRSDGTAPLRTRLADRERRERLLNAAELETLGSLGRRAEAHFGAPQVIEWASDGGRFYLLDIRPMQEVPAVLERRV